MTKVLVVAPHPDDETLGCGGSLLRHKDEGDDLFWVIITGINVEDGWSPAEVKKRDDEIKKAEKCYKFNKVFNFRLPTTKIDSLPFTDLIEKISDVYKKVEPEIIYMPFMYDVHTDHKTTAKAIHSTLKWFRYSHLKKVLMYETLSETEFNFLSERAFKPNVFMDISDYLEIKINTMKIFKSEMGKFPFPRSEKNIRSLASFRGGQSGFLAAEAFELVYERK